MTIGTLISGLGQVSLLVRDIGRSEVFYRDVLGLRHLYTFGQLAFFEIGDARLYLQAVADDEWAASSLLYFRVADIAAAHAALGERAVAFIDEPRRIHAHEDGTEEWMTFFEDLDGNRLALMATVPAAPGQRSSER